MPAYETDEDRANEARVATEWASRRNFRQFKIGYGSHIDRAFVNHTDIIVGFGEVKCQIDPIKKYRYGDPRFGGGYKLPEEKLQHAMMLNLATSCPVYLIVELYDALIWLDMARARPEYGHSLGRDDRGDDNDHYDAVLFAWPAFTVNRRAAPSPSGSSPASAAAT